MYQSSNANNHKPTLTGYVSLLYHTNASYILNSARPGYATQLAPVILMQNLDRKHRVSSHLHSTTCTKARSPNFGRGPNSGRWQFNPEFLEELSTMLHCMLQ